MVHFNRNSIPSRRFSYAFLMAILGIFLISGFFVGCRQQDKNTPTNFIDIWRVGDKAIPATVYIEVISREETVEPLPAFLTDSFFCRYFDVEMLNRKLNDELVGQGSGMIIDPEGHILTNHHVVKGATKIEVRLANGRWCLAKLIGTDPGTDLAVIRIYDTISLPHVIFGNSNDLTVDEPVATAGYMVRVKSIQSPRLSPTVFCGQIRALQPNGITYCSVCPDSWSTDVGNNTGNSGALLLNRQGEVVGVDVAIVTQFNDTKTLGFAIPSNTAVSVAKKLISNFQLR
jgi:S1-C subfamily serine protease